MQKKVITIVGTTAVGKSDLAIALAKKFDGEIINADSLQVYKGAPILTNKVVVNDPKHHLMNFIEWDKNYSVRDFIQDADSIIADICKRGKMPIIVGGTNYYIELLLWGNDFRELSFEDESKQFNDWKTDTLIEKVKEFNIDYAIKHQNNRRKLVYALNMNAAGHTLKTNFSDRWTTKCRYDSIFVWCAASNKVLDKRIDDRVDQMVGKGLLSELDELDSYWKQRHSVFYNDIRNNEVEGIFQSIGFKEFYPYIRSKDDASLKVALDLMKLRTRQYARSQIKWIRARIVPRLFSPIHDSPSHLFVVDCSVIKKWEETVIPSAINGIEKFLNGIKIDRKESLSLQFSEYQQLDLDPIYLDEIFKTHIRNVYPDPIVFLDPNERFDCAICKRVVFGSRSWSAHLNSRKHKKLEREPFMILQDK